MASRMILFPTFNNTHSIRKISRGRNFLLKATSDASGSDPDPDPNAYSLKHTFIVKPSSRSFFVVLEIFPYADSDSGAESEAYILPCESSPNSGDSTVKPSESTVVDRTYSVEWYLDIAGKLLDDCRWVLLAWLKKEVMKTIGAINVIALMSLVPFLNNAMQFFANSNHPMVTTLKLLLPFIVFGLQLYAYKLVKDDGKKRKKKKKNKK